MPYVVGAALFGWMFAYGRRARLKGERLAAAAPADIQRGAPEHAVPRGPAMVTAMRQPA